MHCVPIGNAWNSKEFIVGIRSLAFFPGMYSLVVHSISSCSLAVHSFKATSIGCSAMDRDRTISIFRLEISKISVMKKSMLNELNMLSNELNMLVTINHICNVDIYVYLYHLNRIYIYITNCNSILVFGLFTRRVIYA